MGTNDRIFQVISELYLSDCKTSTKFTGAWLNRIVSPQTVRGPDKISIVFYEFKTALGTGHIVLGFLYENNASELHNVQHSVHFN